MKFLTSFKYKINVPSTMYQMIVVVLQVKVGEK